MTDLRPAARRAPSTHGLRHAASRVLFFALIGGIILGLWWLRTTSSLAVQLAIAAVVAMLLALALRRHPGARLLVAYVVGCALFTSLRSLVDETGLPVHYHYVIALDRSVFGVLPSAWLQEHLYRPGHTSPLDVFCLLVYFSYFTVVHVVAFAVWFRRRERFPFFAAAVLMTFYGGLLVSLLLPTAPPWLAAREGLAPPVVRIGQVVIAGLAHTTYDASSPVTGGNAVAAMPSLHTALTVIVALSLARFGRSWRILGALYAASMVFSLVYLGEHYVVDTVAGALLALASWQVARRLFWRDQAAVVSVEELTKAAKVPLEAGRAA